MKNKVALINPRKGWRPALGLLYIASYLRQAGYEVCVIEFIDDEMFPGKNTENWDIFNNFDPDFVGMGIISWNRRVALEILKKIRKNCQDTILICGGKDPNFKPEMYLDTYADFVVLGEGELTMVDLLDSINSGKDIEEVNGLIFYEEGQFHTTDKRAPQKMKDLLFPAYELIDYDHYCDIRLGGIPGHFIRTGFIMANRGCPYRCRFCTDPIRNIYRERSIDNIIEEIKWQMSHWKIEGMVFLDDLFYHNDKRVAEFCNRVIEEKIELSFYAQTRVDRVGAPETLALMKKAGFLQLALGVESGSQRMLDIMNKGTSIEEIKHSIRSIETAGIYSYTFLIVGFPEETEEDLALTADLLDVIKPTFATVNYFMPMPGTQYFNEEDEKDLSELSFSLSESPQEFRSPVPKEKIIEYRNLFLSKAKRNANYNLLRYPSFVFWVMGLVLFHPDVLLRGILLQKKKKVYTGYFEAIRTAMINYRIFKV